ncbi:hypothetical protein [Oenococcus oeni]|uniref:hypothetical protein n=1 Tax=Oenococcus oeni TaxID=1247 RepID=UPI0009B53452|nr:hypothetical protein [Oenococcus oeni]
MATYNLSIRYSGDAIKDGRIPIKDLAPSLLALSDTFQNAQHVLHPEEKTLSLDIKASEKGSFIVNLILTNGPDLFSKAIDLLNGSDSQALVNLVTYATVVGGVTKFAISSYKKKIRSKEETSNGKIKITFSDGTSIEVSKDTMKAALDADFRKSLKDVYQPLKKPVLIKSIFLPKKLMKKSPKILFLFLLRMLMHWKFQTLRMKN